MDMEISIKIVNGFFHTHDRGCFRIIQNINFEFQEGQEMQIEEDLNGKEYGVKTYRVKKVERKLTNGGNLHVHYHLDPISAYITNEYPLFFETKTN
jgi:hypothetical protein